MRKGWRYFLNPSHLDCRKKYLGTHWWKTHEPVNIPDDLKKQFDEVPVLQENMRSKCQYCGVAIKKTELFCKEHATEDNLTIFEATQELPVHPRGWWSYEIIKDWLCGEKKILLKSPGGSGKSNLEDLIAYMNFTLFEGSFTLIGSISMKIASEHIARIRDWINISPFRSEKGDYESKEEIKSKKTGSRILAIAQCFTDNAEILTDNGWKYFKNLTIKDRVAEINNNDELNFVIPDSIINEYYKGEIYHYKSHSIDFQVTPNHKLFVSSGPYRKNRNGTPYRLKTVDEINSQHWLSSNIKWKGESKKYYTIPKLDEKWFDHHYTIEEKKIPMEDWLQFLGLYIAEGNCEKSSHKVIISQSQNSIHNPKIIEIMNKMPYYNSFYDAKDGSRRYYIENKQLWKILKPLGNSRTKYIPKYVKKLKPSLIQLFLDGYLMGDGYKDTFTGLPAAGSASKLLMDDVQECFLKVGKSNSVVRIADKKNNLWRCKQRIKPINISKNFLTKELYSGSIYCIEVPSHKILVRVNGVPFISGNSESTRGGYHPSLIILDELARIRPGAYWGMFYQMGKSTGATEIAVSTPFLSCYDNQTEILTENGFKLFKEVLSSEQVATMNLNTDILEYQKPTKRLEYDYEGKLVSINAKGINLNITPNHKIYFKDDYGHRHNKSYKYCNAENLINEGQVNIPLATLPSEGIEIPHLEVPQTEKLIRDDYLKTEFSFKIPMDLWLEFLGYFLSEGSITTNGRVQISQKKFRNEMFNCCRKIAKYFRRKGGETDVKFRFQSPQLNLLLKGEKRIPDYVYKCSLRQRNIFLEALNLGDGTQNASKYGAYQIHLNGLSEKLLIDDLQRLFVGMGIPTVIYKKGESQIAVVGNTLRFTQLRRERDMNRAISNMPYNGKVYCVEVPNHTLIVRRNGKVSISGNSGPFVHLWYSNTARNYSIALKDCWFMEQDLIEKARKSGMTESYIEQIFNAEFITFTDRVISDEMLLNSIIDKPTGRAKEFIMGIDFGRKRDETAIVVMSNEGEIVFTDTFQMDWKSQYALIRKHVKEFNPYHILADSSSIGDPILSELDELDIEGISMHNDKLKKRLIDNIQLCFSYGSIHIPKQEEKLIDQISTFVYLDENMVKCGPEGGGKDDMVDALCIAAMGLEREDVEGENKNVWAGLAGGATKALSEEKDSTWRIIW